MRKHKYTYMFPLTISYWRFCWSAQQRTQHNLLASTDITRLTHKYLSHIGYCTWVLLSVDHSCTQRQSTGFIYGIQQNPHVIVNLVANYTIFDPPWEILAYVHKIYFFTLLLLLAFFKRYPSSVIILDSQLLAAQVAKVSLIIYVYLDKKLLAFTV